MSRTRPSKGAFDLAERILAEATAPHIVHNANRRTELLDRIARLIQHDFDVVERHGFSTAINHLTDLERRLWKTLSEPH